MSPEREADQRGAEQPSGSSAHPEGSIAELAQGWVLAAGSRVQLTARLALAEARLAVMSLSLMLLLVVVAAVFLLAAWGMLMAGVVTGLVGWGVPLWMSLLVFGLLHAIGAWLLIRLTFRLSVHLELPATRRQLGGKPHPEGDQDAA